MESLEASKTVVFCGGHNTPTLFLNRQKRFWVYREYYIRKLYVLKVMSFERLSWMVPVESGPALSRLD